VLLAGTGAIAAALAGRRLFGLRGGHGWLLGDEGSGFWIGRQAARAALAALDDHAPIEGLTAAMLDAYQIREVQPGDPTASADRRIHRDLRPSSDRLLAYALINNANAGAPIELAGLVPLVFSLAEQGEPAAVRIVRDAADHLVAILGPIRQLDDVNPIVLAGGVLSPGTPVRRLVLAEVSETWPKAAIGTALDGAAGAAWLAALQVLGEGRAARELHSILLPAG
jgi:glucosamine kinase